MTRSALDCLSNTSKRLDALWGATSTVCSFRISASARSSLGAARSNLGLLLQPECYWRVLLTPATSRSPQVHHPRQREVRHRSPLVLCFIIPLSPVPQTSWSHRDLQGYNMHRRHLALCPILLLRSSQSSLMYHCTSLQELMFIINSSGSRKSWYGI